MEHIALLDSGVWGAGFLKKDVFHAAADKLIARLLSSKTIIVVPEIVRAEVLNVVLHQSLNLDELKSIHEQFRTLSPFVKFRQGDAKFWNEFMSQQLSRLFLKTMDCLLRVTCSIGKSKPFIPLTKS